MSTQNNATTVSRRRVGTLGSLFIASALVTSGCGGGGGGSAAPSGPLDVVPDPVDPVVTPTPDPVVTPTPVDVTPDPVVSTDPTNPDFIKGEAHYDYTDPALYDFSETPDRPTIVLAGDEFSTPGMVYKVKFRDDADVTIASTIGTNIDVIIEGGDFIGIGRPGDDKAPNKDIPDNVTFTAPDAQNLWSFRNAGEDTIFTGKDVTTQSLGDGYNLHGDSTYVFGNTGNFGTAEATVGDVRVYGNTGDFNGLSGSSVLIAGNLGYFSGATASGPGVSVGGDAKTSSVVMAENGQAIVNGKVEGYGHIVTQRATVNGTYDLSTDTTATICADFNGGFVGEGNIPEIPDCASADQANDPTAAAPQAAATLRLTGGIN